MSGALMNKVWDLFGMDPAETEEEEENIYDYDNEEEEVELSIKYEEYNSLIFIIENVLKMKSMESYERYRTTYYNNEIEIAVDEYPFGIALEIENKSNSENPKEIVKKWTELLNLDINNSYKLSWDDKYTSLCKQQNIEIFKHVTFDKEMPEIK